MKTKPLNLLTVYVLFMTILFVSSTTYAPPSNPDADKGKSVPKEDPRLKALDEQATEIRKGLDELEKRFRTPPEARGIVYDDDKVANLISTARSYTGSSQDAPTSTAAVYHDLARQALEEALAAVDEFMTGKLNAFSQSVANAGIGLFMR
jgi:hypothetical protein